MKKRVLSVLLTLVMLLSLLPTVAVGAGSPISAYANSFEYLKTYLGSSDYNYKVILSANINITGTITIPAGMNAILDMDGYKLYRNTDNIAFEVKGTLTVINSSGTASEFHGHSTDYYNTQGSAYSSKTLFYVNGGTLNLNEENDNGKITLMNNQAHDGGAVLVENGGTLNMYNGITIYHCQAEGGGEANHGGAVYVNNGSTFNMHGGTIDGCIAQYGGAVCTHESVFNMDGGTIQNCTLAGNGNHCGGAIYLWGHKSTSQMTTISGGIIQNNGGIDVDTGGVYVDNAYLTVEGNVQFIGNSSDKEGWPSTLNVIAHGTITVKGGYFGQQGSGGGKTITYFGDGEDLKITGGKFYRFSPNRYEYKNDSGSPTTLEYNSNRSCAVYLNNNYGGGNQLLGQTSFGHEMPAIGAGAPTRTGYTFGGYYDQYDDQYYDSSAGRISSKECDYVGTMNLYAHWSENKHTIKYDDNVSAETITVPNNQTVYYTTAASLSATEPVRTGWTFKGWNTKDDGTGTHYDAGASIHTANNVNVGAFYTDLGTKSGEISTLYAIWQKDVAYRGAYVETDKTNRFDKFADAVNGQSSGTIYLHATPLAKEESVSVNSGVTIELFDNAGSITTTASSVFDYLEDGTLVLKSGGVKVNGTAKTTFYVYYPNDTETPHKLEIKQDGQDNLMTVSYDSSEPSIPVIENLGAGDELYVDGTKITGGGSGTIKLTNPPQPFPGATKITIPAGQGGMTSVSPDGTSPAVGTPSTNPKNQGDVIITPPDEDEDDDGFPVKILVEEDGDQVIIDPDGEGGSKPPVSYETTQENTELEVNKDGNVVLADGGVELDYVSPNGESIYIKNSKAGGTDVLITNAGTATPVKVSAKETSGGAPYTIVIPKNGSVTIGEALNATTYTNPSSSATTTLTVDFDDDGNPVVELVSGTVELNGGEDKGGESEKKESIVVDDVTVTNESEQLIRITETKEQSGSDDGKFNIQTGEEFADTYHYSKGDGDDLTVKKNDTTENLQFILDSPGEQVSFTGKTSQNVEFSDGDNVFVTVDEESTGNVTVENTSTTEPPEKGMTITIVNGSGETTTVKVGGTSYTVPESTTTTLSVDTYNGVAVMCGEKGAVTMPTEGAGNAGKVYVDNVLVSNTSGADLTVTDNSESSGDDGLLTLRSGTYAKDTFYYTAADAYEAATVYDLDVKKNDSTGNLQFVLNTQGEKVNFTGAKSTDVEFADGGSNVCVTADKDSTGTITVTKGSFTVDVNNTNAGTSTVKVGAHTYTVPAGKTAALSAATATEIAKLTSGSVELEKTEIVKIPTTSPYTVTNATTDGDKVITVTAKTDTNGVTGADILVPSGATFTVTPSDGGNAVSYTATGKLASKYVADSSGNVSLNGMAQEGETNPGVQLVLTEGNVTLDPGETVYTDSGKVILNSNTGAENTITPEIAISGNIGDTNIPLSDGQKVTIGEKLLNGAVQTPKGEYEAVDSATVSIDKSTTDAYDNGTVKLTAGAIKLDADDMPIGITGATAKYFVDVPEGKATAIVTYGAAGTCTVTIPASGEADITVGGNTYKYINNSAEDVTVSITANGTLKTVLNNGKAPDYLPTVPDGSSTPGYEGYCQSVSGNTTQYIFEDDLDLLLSKAYLDAISGEDADKDKATKGIQNTVVLNTNLSTNPTTTGYILTQNCINIYTAQGNLALNGKHSDVTAYTGVGSVTPALYTVDSRERSQQYVSNQSIAGDITSCMVVKISNEYKGVAENGHVEVQAGEAKIKWTDNDTTYYVTLADALYDAANVVDTSLNQYNKHNGKGSAQTIVMNINPYGDRVGMTLEEGDKLTVRGEDVSKEGDSFTATADATISMYTAKGNNVYLTAGTVKADNSTVETNNGVKVYVNTTDDSYYATSDKSITVTGGKTADADTFAELSAAAKVATTEADQTVTVGVGTKDSHADTVEFTSATETSAYPICRVGKLDNVNDKVTVKGANTANYTVYSLVNRGEEYTAPIDKYTKIVDLAANGSNTHNMTITNGSGVTNIVTAGALSEVTVPKDSTLTVTVGANVYKYVNDSNGPVSMSLTGTGATMNTVLNESMAPTNLPKGTYDAYVIKTETENNTTTTTYTFQNGMDAIFAKAALEAGKVHTVVINTDLETKPSTTTYIHTKNGYDIYGVEGKLTAFGRDDTKYTGISEVKTVDARERVAFHTLDANTVNAVKKCMMVKVENGKVYVEASEARIEWPGEYPSYYLTLADAIYDAAHNKADGTTSEVYNNNTHNGKGSVQTIIMNTNPYANRENMAMENGDILMTCGENIYNAGDKYTAAKNAVITMFKSHNDVYLTSGLLQADANAIEGEDKTVTVYVNTEDSGYYASSEQRIFVTAGKSADADTFASLLAAARVATTEANQSVTVGIGGTDTAIFTAVLGDTSYPICRIGHLYRAGDTVNVDGENVQNYTVYSLLRVYDKNYKPLEPKYEYAKIFVPAANTGDTVIVNGMEQNKLGTVRVNSAAANDKFILWMPQELLPLNYSVAEAGTAAVFNAPHELTLVSGGYRFIGERTFRINGVDFKGKDAATAYTVAHRSRVDIVDICDEVYGVSAGKTVYVAYNEGGRTVKYGDKTYTSTNSSAAVMIPGKTANVDPAGGSDIYADYQDQTHHHFYVIGPVFSGHAIKIDEADKGTVVSDVRSAKAGTVVTLTVKADVGYKLKSLRVLDFDGKEVKLTDLGDGKYSFTMPGSSVTVKAEFIGEGESVGFIDVPADAYYADAVAWAAENDITKGTDAVHFSPNAPVTRAQVVTFLWRAAGKPVVNYAMSFADVSGDAYYTEAVRWAVAEGITKGTSDTTFSPDKVCTRGQIVTFLARFAGVEDDASGYSHGFTDVKATDYYNNAVAWAKDNGVTEGTSKTTFSPNTDCTRAQVVTFLWRWMVK